VNKKRVLNKILNWYILVGVVMLVVATLFILSPIYPYIWFQINNDALAKEQANVVTLINNIDEEERSNTAPETPDLPSFDSSLTSTNTLLIPSIGVVGAINENSIPENGLSKGVWRVSEWGDPINNTNPIILASHRFGYLAWSNSYRKKNSFENLPKTKVGDTIEIIWEQRRFRYKIYKVEENTKIADYKANLILYTCKTLNSEIRVFRYAMRVE